MSNTAWVPELFKAIDTKDTDKFCSFITDDGVFRFGNMPPVTGQEKIHELVGGFFDSLKGLAHTVPDTWEIGDVVIIRGEVTYTRNDDTRHTVPFCNVFRMDGDKIADYAIYIDNSELYK